MSKIKILSILFILSFGFTFSQNGWLKIDKESYSIQYPSEWQLDTSGRNKTEFIVLSKREENDPFRENVNLIIQDLSNRIMNLDTYVSLSKNVINREASAKIIQSKDVKKDEIIYHEIIWKGYVNKQKLKFKQRYFVQNNVAYSLTLTCTEKEYDNYITIGNKILNSFTPK